MTGKKMSKLDYRIRAIFENSYMIFAILFGSKVAKDKLGPLYSSNLDFSTFAIFNKEVFNYGWPSRSWQQATQNLHKFKLVNLEGLCETDSLNIISLSTTGSKAPNENYEAFDSWLSKTLQVNPDWQLSIKTKQKKMITLTYNGEVNPWDVGSWLI